MYFCKTHDQILTKSCLSASQLDHISPQIEVSISVSVVTRTRLSWPVSSRKRIRCWRMDYQRVCCDTGTSLLVSFGVREGILLQDASSPRQTDMTLLFSASERDNTAAGSIISLFVITQTNVWRNSFSLRNDRIAAG